MYDLNAVKNHAVLTPLLPISELREKGSLSPAIVLRRKLRTLFRLLRPDVTENFSLRAFACGRIGKNNRIASGMSLKPVHLSFLRPGVSTQQV